MTSSKHLYANTLYVAAVFQYAFMVSFVNQEPARGRFVASLRRQNLKANRSRKDPRSLPGYTVHDFEQGLDRVDLSSLGIAFGDLTVATIGSDAVITVDGVGADQFKVTIKGVAATDMGAGDFIL